MYYMFVYDLKKKYFGNKMDEIKDLVVLIF